MLEAESARTVTRTGVEVVLAPLAATDHDTFFHLFAAVVEAKEGFPQSPPLTWDVFDATWISGVTISIAATVDGELVGAYHLKPNFPGRGSHVANAGYVVDAPWRGRGIGEILLADSIERAPGLGFDAIQFNLVFESNPARRLYEKMGWRQIGQVPRAIDGQDAIIYWRAVP